MDLNDLILWSALFAAGAALLQALRNRVSARGWIVVLTFVIAISLVAWRLAPGIAGYLSFGLLLALVTFPSLLFRRAMTLAARQQHDRAAALMRWVRWLHPADGWLEQPLWFAALGHANRGEFDAALAVLARPEFARGRMHDRAELQRWNLQRDFASIAAWAEAHPDLLRTTPEALALSLRALGELRRIDAMITLFDAHRDWLESTAQLAGASLFVFAYAGQRARLERIFEYGLVPIDPTNRTSWLALASVRGGELEAARTLLESVRAGANPLQRIGIDKLLGEIAAPESPAVHLSSEAEAALERIARAVDAFARYGVRAAGKTAAPVVTRAFVALNVVAFVIESVTGDARDPQHLFDLGAFWAPAVLQRGEWWRAFTFLFLHFGVVHLVANMLGLLVLGGFVERFVGRARFALIYLASGLVGAGVYTLRAYYFPAQAQLVVGASGCIMGVLGATATLLARGWRVEGASMARRRFFALVAITAMQVVFDLTTPQIGFVAHASGLVTGALLGLIPARHRAATV